MNRKMDVPALKKSKLEWNTGSATKNEMKTKSFCVQIAGLPDIVCFVVCSKKCTSSDKRYFEQSFSYELFWNDSHTTPIFYTSEVTFHHLTFSYLARNQEVWKHKIAGEQGAPVSSEKKAPKGEGALYNIDSGDLIFSMEIEFDLMMSRPHTIPTSIAGFALPLLTEGMFSDVAIVCGNKTFACHKNILAGRSEFFKTMLTSSFKEAKENKIELKVPEDVAAPIIWFIYSDYVTEECITWKLFEAAKMYDLPKLMYICITTLGRNLSVNNACEMLVQAYKHDLNNLFDYTLKFIKRNKADVANTDGWKDITGNNDLIIKIILAALE